MLLVVDWLVTDVSGQSTGSMFKGQAVHFSRTVELTWTDCPETSVNNYQRKKRKIPIYYVLYPVKYSIMQPVFHSTAPTS